MVSVNLSTGSMIALPKQELDLLLSDLRDKGYQTVGPRYKDAGIIYTEIEGLKDLPAGIETDQAPGSYRVIQTSNRNFFNFIPGSQSWKQFLFPPHTSLFNVANEGSWKVSTHNEDTPRYALVGVRACELAAISIQDRVFVRSDFTDPVYKARRESLFIIAVNCLDPDATCFCTSMGTGPRHSSGYDLCLTELDDVFLVEIGSELGGSLIQPRNFSLPSAFMQHSADLAIEQAISSISRKLDTADLPELLLTNLDSEHWTEVGKRCLSCANCTLVCPTCFCWDVSDQGSLSGTSAGRIRVWDSCFNPNYSYVFGGNTRPNIRSRYRQWLTHKLGTWKEQFGVLGCVGCGRCITWCPAGIDLTQEIASLRAEATK